MSVAVGLIPESLGYDAFFVADGWGHTPLSYWRRWPPGPAGSESERVS
jgi:hypothetical protein